jgi:hypothetical protein
MIKKRETRIGCDISCRSLTINLGVVVFHAHWHVGGYDNIQILPTIRMRRMCLGFFKLLYGEYIDFDSNKKVKGWHKEFIGEIKIPWRYHSR